MQTTSLSAAVVFERNATFAARPTRGGGRSARPSRAGSGWRSSRRAILCRWPIGSARRASSGASLSSPSSRQRSTTPAPATRSSSSSPASPASASRGCCASSSGGPRRSARGRSAASASSSARTSCPMHRSSARCARSRGPTTRRSTSSPTPTRSELARLAPELGEPATERLEDREGEAQRRLFDSLLALLERLGERRGGRLLARGPALGGPLDALLPRLPRLEPARRAGARRRHLSIGRAAPAPSAAAAADRARARPCARRLELRPFDRDELGAQLADILGSIPPDDVVARLFDRSEGNPLFTEELLAGGLDGRGALPPTLREALLTRLERLSPDARADALGCSRSPGAPTKPPSRPPAALEAPSCARGFARRSPPIWSTPTRPTGSGFATRCFARCSTTTCCPASAPSCTWPWRGRSRRAAGDERAPGRSTAIAHHYHIAGEQAEALRTAVAAARQRRAGPRLRRGRGAARPGARALVPGPRRRAAARRAISPT